MASSSPSASSSSRVVSWLSAFAALAAVALALLLPEHFEAALGSARGLLTQLQPPAPVFDCAAAERFLTDANAVRGFHVLCVKAAGNGSVAVEAFKDGNAPAVALEADRDLKALRRTLEKALRIEKPKNKLERKLKQPYAFFTLEGERLARLDDMVDSVVFLFEGGQFIWPGVRVGHKTTIKDVQGKGDLVMETLSMEPLVFSIEEFLADDEIDVIMDLSLDHLVPSGVLLRDGHENRPMRKWRTSTTYFLESSTHPMLAGIDQRVADVTKVPASHQEPVQVLRYGKSQKYDLHTDYFPVEEHRNSPAVLRMIDHGYKNRMATVFWYMSDVAKGGHTVFPHSGGGKPVNMQDCNTGLKVPPQKRKVIVFYSMLPTGEVDPLSLHGGCPVVDGVKYSGNKWVWNKPMLKPQA